MHKLPYMKKVDKEIIKRGPAATKAKVGIDNVKGNETVALKRAFIEVDFGDMYVYL